ncbi:MAG: TatD family hydrolase [Sedimenticola sp.]|nr:TatD family hydrolase [Sedimenticola sp.]
MAFIDTHAHLDDPRFDADLTEVITRSLAIGIEQIIVPSIQASGWARLQQLSQQYTQLLPAYGLHPMFMHQHRRSHIAELHDWLNTHEAIAIGECGLDFYIPDPDKQEQQWFFEAQLALADEFQLPVIIHARKSVEQVIQTLRHFPTVTGVLHSFSGSQQQAEQLIEMGFLLGFGGPATYSRASRLHALIRWLPLSSLLLETDAPDQPDSTHRGERNEPAYLQRVIEAICSLKGISQPALEEATTTNAQRLFKLPLI